MTTLITIDGATTIEPDACLSRTTDLSADVTRWPVEDRSTIADHVIVQPSAYSLDLVFARLPVRTTQGPAAGDTRPGRAFALLSDALTSRSTITLQTPDGTVTDLVCTQVSSPQTIDSGTGRRVSLRLEQVRRATSQEVSVPVRRRAARLRTRSAEQDAGALFQRAALAAEIGLSVLTLTPQAGAVAAAATGSASLAARTSGALATSTKSEVGRILGIDVSLVAGG